MSTIAVDTQDFRVEVADGVAEIILGAPGVTPTLGPTGHREIGRIWSRLDHDAAVRAMLIRSEGKAFCAGGSLDAIHEMFNDQSARLQTLREARALVQGMIECDKPIVSAINGAAVGAGLALALLADVSVAARDAKLIDGHTRIGVAAGDHAVLLWPLLCGLAKAKYYLLLCETISGEDAERAGLVSLSVESQALQETSRTLVARLAKGSASALAFTKRSLNHWLRSAWPAFEASLAHEILGFAGPDAREGVAAIAARRPPQFKP